MKKNVLLLALLTMFAVESQGATKYQCAGPNVSGTVSLQLLRQPTQKNPFPPTAADSHLVIFGRARHLLERSELSYWRDEIPLSGGAWRYNYSTRIFRIGGGGLFGPQTEFHIQVDAYGAVRGYYGYKDAYRSPLDRDDLDFNCTAI